MKIAVTIWNDRIAPVFDVARDIRIVEVVEGRTIDQEEDILTGELPVQKALRLVELEVDTLICGAISRPVRTMIASYGIQVIPFLAGNPEAVVQAWIKGRLTEEVFMMPGCRRRGRHPIHSNTNESKEVNLMNGKKQGGRGGGRGQGGGGGRGQGPAVADRVGGVVRSLPMAAPPHNRADSAAAPSAGSANPTSAVFPASCKNAPHAAAP